MQKAFYTAWNGLSRMARDRQALALLILMPMILIGILGAALNNGFRSGSIQRFDVLLVNEDQGAYGLNLGRILAEQVLGSEPVQELVRVLPAADAAAAREQVAGGAAVAAIRVPPGYTRGQIEGGGPPLVVWSDPGRPWHGEIVAAIVRQFSDGVQAVALSFLLGGIEPPALPTAGGGFSPPVGAGAPDQGQELVRQMQEEIGRTMPRVVSVPAGTRSVTALEYYAAAMSAMFMVMTALGRAGELIRERQQGTLPRMLVTPTPRAAIIAGQILGSLAILLAQFGVLYLGTRWVYGVQWGPLPAVLALGTAFGLAVTGIGTAVTAFINDPRAADASIGVVGTLFAALSGGMIPLYAFPPALKAAAHLVPNYWALKGFLDLMSGMGPGAVLQPAAVLAAVGLAAGALGTWRLAAR